MGLRQTAPTLVFAAEVKGLATQPQWPDTARKPCFTLQERLILNDLTATYDDNRSEAIRLDAALGTLGNGGGKKNKRRKSKEIGAKKTLQTIRVRAQRKNWNALPINCPTAPETFYLFLASFTAIIISADQSTNVTMKANPSIKSMLALLALASFAYANNALDVNTNTQNNKTVQIAITTWGSDFYYSIMSVMGATAIGILAASAVKPRSDRVFFYMSAALCFVACIAYFAMGSNLGWTPIDVEWVRGTAGVRGTNREIFYARYIDW
ncbi:hypothetical protein B0A55_13334 [Friedmanniomyces simplex]|uniref:Uncharacterized protein n=1 Tax=Friedmanniomyces simplex TaxID=329884 RepID=A0A4U0W9A5_9PEZI|nr:hypothetical protein B0A55_13334 [Friedmanniomyces simplex]